MKLTEKLCAIMGELKPIVKEKKPGAGVSYAFRGIDDVVNALNPLLVKARGICYLRNPQAVL
jgi:hypothetical protein